MHFQHAQVYSIFNKSKLCAGRNQKQSSTTLDYWVIDGQRIKSAAFLFPHSSSMSEYLPPHGTTSTGTHSSGLSDLALNYSHSFRLKLKLVDKKEKDIEQYINQRPTWAEKNRANAYLEHRHVTAIAQIATLSMKLPRE